MGRSWGGGWERRVIYFRRRAFKNSVWASYVWDAQEKSKEKCQIGNWGYEVLEECGTEWDHIGSLWWWEEKGRWKIEASEEGGIGIWEENCNWSGDGKHLKEARMFQKQQSKVTNTLTPPLHPSIYGQRKTAPTWEDLWVGQSTLDISSFGYNKTVNSPRRYFKSSEFTGDR